MTGLPAVAVQRSPPQAHATGRAQYRLLDALRGLAALGVVLFHLGAPSGSPNYVGGFLQGGGWGPIFFFVISGYVIYQALERQSAHGSIGAIRFARNRIRRIYPAFLASLPLAFIVPVLGRHEHFSLVGLLTLVTLTYSIFGFHSPETPYWTLVIEQQFYIVMAVLLGLAVTWRYRVPLIVASVIMISALHLLGDIPANLALLPYYWEAFALGILVYLILSRSGSRRLTVPALLILIGVRAVTTAGIDPIGIFALLILLLARWDELLAHQRWMAPFRALGLISFSLYLIHVPVILLTQTTMRHLFPALAHPGSITLFVVGLCCSLAAAVPFYYLFERPFLSRYRRGIEAPIVPTETPRAQPALGATVPDW